MVQRYNSPVSVFKYPFEMVMAAYEKRFPTCKMIPEFLGSEIISEYDDGTVQFIERRCLLAVDAPYLVKKLVNTDQVSFIQRNTLDRQTRRLTIEAQNETFVNRVTIKELCTYSVHAENSNWTCYEQEASLDVKSFFGFEGTVEKVAMRQYARSIQKGREVIKHFIRELIDSGVTRIPTWHEGRKDSTFDQSQSSSDEGIASSRLENRSRMAASRGHQVRGHLVRGHVITSGGTIIATSSTANGSYEDMSCKLEADYIQRYLGILTPLEESRLLQFRRWIQETHKGKIPKDRHMLRFLRARDFNVEKGRETICHSLAWRKQHSIDRLLDSYSTPPTISQYYPGGWHHSDREGRPLFVLRLGAMDIKGLLKSVGFDGMQKHILVIIEQGLKLCEEATEKLGRPISNITLLVDLEGLSTRHLWRPGLKGLLKVIEVAEVNYPETMGQLLMVRTPRVFPILWTLVSPLLDEKTRSKCFVFSVRDNNAGAGQLTNYVSPENLPTFLGGESPCSIPDGGLVPKSLYIFSSDEECLRSSAFMMSGPDYLLSLEGIYKTAFVTKDFPHEVLIQAEKGSVITWDFDVLKGDVTFTLMRCRSVVTSSPHEHHVSGAVGGVGSTQYTSRDWLLGVDVTPVEPPLVCRVGDSMQGSHVTSQMGSYILQWKHFDSSKSSFDILTSQRSKFMYYTEMISSESFRGSMPSILSDSLSQELVVSSL